MVNIQELIGKVCPEAVFEENEITMAVVPDAKWHATAEALKNAGFDCLAALGRRNGLYVLSEINSRQYNDFCKSSYC